MFIYNETVHSKPVSEKPCDDKPKGLLTCPISQFCNKLVHFYVKKYTVCVVNLQAGNTNGGSITVLLTSCLPGLESTV